MNEPAAPENCDDCEFLRPWEYLNGDYASHRCSALKGNPEGESSGRLESCPLDKDK